MKFYYSILLILLFTSCVTSERIIFSSGRAGNSDIYMMQTSGKNLVQLTNSPAEEWAPVLFGSDKISFLRQDKSIKRYVLDLNTLEESEIPHPENCVLDDKNMICDKSGKNCVYECKGEIYLSSNGKSPVNLTRDLSGSSYKVSWFPDEKSIAFTNDQTGNSEIYKLKLDGTRLQNLTQNPANDEAPSISPDGKYLLFSSNRDGNNNQELYIQNLETGATVNITQTPNWELIGRWSSDGKKNLLWKQSGW